MLSSKLHLLSVLAPLVLAAGGCVADDAALDTQEPAASTEDEISISHNSTWTIDRGAAETVRVVAFGDSIFAGYRGGIFDLARRAGPYVAGEYLGAELGANVEIVRRTKSGALAKEVYDDTIVRDRSFMQHASTRAVYFEMCGNDYLQARSAFRDASGTCEYRRLEGALATCRTYMEKAMQAINAAAPAGTRKAIANLYYPGFDADAVAARCTDPGGARVVIQDKLLPMMARSNWAACTLAKQHGFACVDSFAEMMGADHDANGDGVVDSVALRFDAEESEEAYVQRITVALRSTVRDSNHKGLGEAGVTADYLLGDDTHPTHHGGTVRSGSTGRGAPEFDAAVLGSGKTPVWDRFGHERMGWALFHARP